MAASDFSSTISRWKKDLTSFRQEVIRAQGRLTIVGRTLSPEEAAFLDKSDELLHSLSTCESLLPSESPGQLKGSWSGVVEGDPGDKLFSVFIQNRGEETAACLQRLAGERREDFGEHRVLQVEGDMLFAAGLDDHSFRSGTLWPNGQVTWSISPLGFSQARISVIRSAIAYLASETSGHLTFIEAAENARLRFQWHENDTNSFVGYMGPSMPWQPINVADWAPMGSVVHELMHALGLWHEHTRADRDEFVTIIWSNITSRARGNFEKRSSWNDLFTYDYDSIMHYGSFGFAIDPTRPTIIPRDPRARIGQRERLSLLDRRTLQTLYPSRPVAVAPAAEVIAPIRREARSLDELREIRERNRAVIERVNGNLGSALGFKFSNGIQSQHPAVLVFVPAKIPASELARSEQIPTWLELEVNNELIWAHTDVIEGGKAPFYTQPSSPLSQENRALSRLLQNGALPLQGGVALFGVATGRGGRYEIYRGTIAAVVRDNNGNYFVLTNQHVAGNVGNVLYRSAGDAADAARLLNQGVPLPHPQPQPIGRTVFAQEYVDRGRWIGHPMAGITRCDFALVQLQVTDNFDPAIHTAIGIFNLTNDAPIQDPVVIDDAAAGLSPIGSFVQRVGTTRGKQSGVIAAVDYEYEDPTDQADRFTDYLIVSDDSSAVFSDQGDSGSLIVATHLGMTDPLALLWGGWTERLRRDRGQERWTYAVSIPRIFAFLHANGFPGLHF